MMRQPSERYVSKCRMRRRASIRWWFTTAIAYGTNVSIADLCATQRLFQSLFDRINALFADFVGIDRLCDDCQQVVDVRLLLIT